MRRDMPLEDRFRPDLVAPLVRECLADGAPPEIPVLRDGDRVQRAPLTHAGARLGDVVLRVEPFGP